MDLWLNEKHLGIVSLTILIAGLIFLIKKWPQNIHHTFSQHAAANKVSTIYYSLLFAVVLPVLAVFLFSWFVPTFDISPLFTLLICLSLLCQFACTLVPEIGNKVKQHQILAGISGLLLLPSLVVCMFAPSLTEIDRLVIIIGIVIMTTVLLLVTRKKIKYALVLQSIYFTAFFAPVLIISYL
jgi:hypothetical protein